MATTYEPIATINASGSGVVTFSSIPQTYTDLRVIYTYPNGYNPQSDNWIYINGDNTTGNYYSTYPYATGGSPSSTGHGYANRYLYFDNAGGMSTQGTFMWADIPNYTVTGKIKTVYYGSSMTQAQPNFGYVQWNYGININVTGAITSVTYANGAGNINSGLTATLFGIKAA
jgi:hypothetical protein